jgi:hypothetical protein
LGLEKQNTACDQSRAQQTLALLLAHNKYNVALLTEQNGMSRLGKRVTVMRCYFSCSRPGNTFAIEGPLRLFCANASLIG